MVTDTDDNKDLQWEERTLCSDEACIGIIGPNGRCNECGKPYAGQSIGEDGEPDEDLALEPDTLLDETDADETKDAPDDEDRDDGEDSHWADRILCRDENCIGVIGPDGRCKECGKPLDEDEA